jgi:putative oxidoreductase
MLRFFNTSSPVKYFHTSMLMMRLAVGAFMLTHGLPKLEKLTSDEPIKFADPFGFGPAASLVLIVFAEVLCSVFIILGLGTRLASMVLLIAMLVAAFHAHANDPFATKEKALMYIIFYAMFLVFGSGKYSIDNLIIRKK